MSYIVGIFERTSSTFFNDNGEMREIQIVDEAKREHLIKCKNDENYQVINLITREYYNPNTNQWVRIPRESL
jgi:hypothetical protein